MCPGECTLFLCYQNAAVCSGGPLLRQLQSDSPIVTLNYFCFWIEWERGKFFSLFTVNKQTKNTVWGGIKMSREMNMCAARAFLKSWRNGQNLNFILCLGDFLFGKVYLDWNWLHETTWFWITRCKNNWLSYIRSSLLNLVFGYNNMARFAWYIHSIMDFWGNLSFPYYVMIFILTLGEVAISRKLCCLNSCKTKWYRASKGDCYAEQWHSLAISSSEKQNYVGKKNCGQEKDLSALIKW